MPLLMPTTRGIRREWNHSGQPTNTMGTAVPSHTVAHQLPSTYTELIATTSFDTDWVEVIIHNNSSSNTNTDSLLNIYVGANSAEQLLIPNLLAGWVAAVASANTGSVKRYGFPLCVPAGSRLSARHQSVRTSTNTYVIITLFGGNLDHWTGTKVECVGAVTGSSRGTSVTPGSGSEGTLTSIGTNTFGWGYVQPMLGGNVTDTIMPNQVILADLASGSATSALLGGLEDFAFQGNQNEVACNVSQGRYAMVPASTTLYLRGQVSGSADANDYCIYGVY